ncbi:hypothetical protein ABZ816_40945 [Actinosynnema sp. NPDC047251]|uniref:Putative secreted protein n=1 Tax=Saccharothrix espanaensis (strain ATCC 51144 / DSM 44229 / JCM 9112 / NBRC 15066 / NRRL 15764) TaxID=1179773 RepID=K0KCS4_SACES|nr:hypothetical protein [Saccharothrix espanaensis]CCH34569.1 putative secreted protein [Saccharothrix espanaensis DSM 44229]
MRPLVLALAVLLAGCTAGEPAAVTTPAGGPPVDFPVDAAPRPVVLIGEALNAEDGLRDGDRLDAAFEFAGQHPPTPAPAEVALPGRIPATMPMIGSADAVRAMSRGTGDPVRLVSAEFGMSGYATDRGLRSLPAWRFTTEAGSVPAWPALEPGTFWKLGEVRPATVREPARVVGERLSVTTQAPPAACRGDSPARHVPVIRETDSTITVGLHPRGHVGDCRRNLAILTEVHEVTLKKPLGNRLLLDGDGGVIAATRM